MDQKIKNSGSRQNRIFEQLAAEKKKTITAICLIAVMAFMWVRVLGGKTGDEAQAALTNATAANKQSNSEPLKITYIDLPVVKGRNDVLNRDFFAVDDAQAAADTVSFLNALSARRLLIEMPNPGGGDRVGSSEDVI